MSGTTTLILGGGWGGMTVAHHLRELLEPAHRVVVVDRVNTFGLGVSNMWLMTGERRRLEDVSRPRQNLRRPGIEWIHAEVLGLDPAARTVDTSVGALSGDFLVIALGADTVPHSVPGFVEAAFDLYDAAQALGLHEALERFEGGNIVVLVAGAPFRCPAAPYEAAMLVDDMMQARDLRHQVEISLYTPEPQPMLVAGQAVSEAVETMLAERKIHYHPRQAPRAVDPGSRSIYLDHRTVPCDLLIGIPPHRAPPPVVDAQLTDESGYVPVHPQTLELLADLDNLEVHYPGVYAIGDVTAIRLLNQKLLPKAGVFAEAQATVVAASIAATIKGEDRPRGFDGSGFCYVEIGEGLAVYGSGDFYAYPAPRVVLEAPSASARKAKQEYEQVLDAWFEERPATDAGY
jgi:sulfide:quinone oxidoreductase